MVGLGTIANTAAIIVGGLGGLVSRRFLKERYQETILKAVGFAIIVMALSSTLSQMFMVNIAGEPDHLCGSLEVQGTMMMIVSLALGALLGEIVDLDHWFERLGVWLRDKTGSQGGQTVYRGIRYGVLDGVCRRDGSDWRYPGWHQRRS